MATLAKTSYPLVNTVDDRIDTLVKYDGFTYITEADKFLDVTYTYVLLSPINSSSKPFGIQRRLFQEFTGKQDLSLNKATFRLTGHAGQVVSDNYGIDFIAVHSIESLNPAIMPSAATTESQEFKRLNALVSAQDTEIKHLELKVEGLTTELANKNKIISHLEYEKCILESQNAELRAQLQAAFDEIKRLSPSDFKEGQIVKVNKFHFKVARTAAGLGMLLLGAVAAAGAIATAPVSAPIALTGGILIGAGGAVATNEAYR